MTDLNIVYITNRKNTFGFDTGTMEDVVEYCSKLDEIPIDIEASGLDPYLSIPLLISIGDKNKQFVIDVTTITDFSKINQLNSKRFIGQNIKYDGKVLRNYGIKFNKVYDTLIAEQTIRKGVKGGNSLDKIKFRYLKKEYEVSKDIRNEFIGKNKQFSFRKDHIIYSAEDVLDLELIKEHQEKWLDRHKVKDWVYNVEFPLIIGLIETENEGITLNQDKWKEIINVNKAKKLELERAMDKELFKLGNFLYPNILQRFRFPERNKITVEQPDLFGSSTFTENKNVKNINYSSDKKIKEIFRATGQQVPTNKDTGKDTTGADALKTFIVLYPETPLKEFLKYFIEFQTVDKNISSFGENFIKMINPVTKRLHTLYRQNGADTGRFQSGDTRNNFINSQQIPKDKRYRECFCELEGYNILTIDLSGAELVILASLSGDKTLAKILDDPHSPLATASYNEIIKFILNNMPERRIKSELIELLGSEERASEAMDKGEFTITKKTAKDLRDPFKSVIYGLAYGASAQRVAEVLSVPLDYAELIIIALRREIPDVFLYLDKASNFGLANGFITLCDRANNRRWFKDVVDAQRYGYELDNRIIGSVKRASKNSPIQGTQACMVKESAVNIYNYIWDNDIDANILLYVHDELVIRYPENMEEFPEQIKKILCDTCNLFLENGMTMDAEYDVKNTWTK
jgi:DNA polymerase I-like protein with 3'-5' exonuclease and polymerase domains